MIDTKELRRLAQAAVPGPDGVSLSWITLLQDFQKGASPATIIEILDRLEAAEKECDACKAAYNEWTAKTEWVQQGFNRGAISAKYLGIHRADVMARLLDEVKKEREALRAKIAEMEQQEPFAWIVRGGYPVPLDKLEWQLWCGSEKPTLSWVNQETRPLYALPGAQGE